MVHLNDDICYTALKTRDRRFDGRFFTAVSSTGIFCRPVCPASTPKRENCTFYPSAAAALKAGYRPCLRCRPETSPASSAWLGTQATVRRAIRLIEEGALDDGESLSVFADRLGLGERHLRRLFQEHLGASPKQIIQTRRLLFAKRLLSQTQAPITEIAHASGFQSLRRFNDAYKKTFQVTPRDERKKTGDGFVQDEITLRLPYRPPYDWKGLLSFYEQRALSGVEWIGNNTYHRTIETEGQNGQISVSCDEKKHRLIVTVSGIDLIHMRKVLQNIRRMFDVDADPEAIAHDLSHDKGLAPVIAKTPGLRLPGAWDGFEIAVRAIIGQQISVKGARTIATRLVHRLGQKRDNETYLFPTPDRIAAGNLEGLGLTSRRVTTLQNLAAHWKDLDRAQPLEQTIKELCALPGIGPWTAHYILMRSFSEPDIYPVDDLGLIRALEKLNQPASKKDLQARAENWRPWRAYGALYLWSVL